MAMLNNQRVYIYIVGSHPSSVPSTLDQQTLFDSSRKQRSKPSILYHPLDSLVGQQQGDPFMDCQNPQYLG